MNFGMYSFDESILTWLHVNEEDHHKWQDVLRCLNVPVSLVLPVPRPPVTTTFACPDSTHSLTDSMQTDFFCSISVLFSIFFQQKRKSRIRFSYSLVELLRFLYFSTPDSESSICHA